MYSNNVINQREVYKLVEKLSSGKYDSHEELLTSLIKEIVEHPEFEIIGGRLWELDSDNASYVLKFQFGKVDRIPDNYTIHLNDDPEMFHRIEMERTLLRYETDSVLKQKGINVFSVTGVGEMIRINHNTCYEYLLGFNAPEILQTFFEILSIISSVATIALRNISEEEKSQKIKTDIVKASEIQNNLLPEHSVKFHDYDVYGVCIPESGVGGDYFDYLKSDDHEEESLGIVLSDAASSGLPAAIQALFVSGAIRMGKSFSTKISQLISRLNTLIFETFFYERFVTLFYCELTLSSNRLILYCNAGHCPPIHYRPETDQFKLLGSTGGLLGLMQYQKFGVENITMHPGDVLLLYTDGITEARNKDGKMFGEDRLYDLIREHHDKSPKDISLYILESVETFASKTNYSDDKTLVVIKRN
jgi:serine phosphatase RsbU (regulator of sigma subunit)